MKLEDFYKAVKNGNATTELIIIKNPKSGNNFVAKQYINAIAKQHNIQKQVINDLNEVKTATTFFDELIEPVLQIYVTDKFTSENADLLTAQNIIINCNSIDKKTEALFKQFIIEIPELVDWQIADYIYSQLENTDTEVLEELTKLCGLNIDRADIEIERLKIFQIKEHSMLFNQFKNDGIYDDLISTNIFDFTNAILQKDIKTIKTLYKQFINTDSSPIGLVTILYKNIRNLINIFMDPNSTAASCGISAGQYAVLKRKFAGVINGNNLYQAFLFLTDIDKKIKTGLLDTNILLDYIIVNILS